MEDFFRNVPIQLCFSPTGCIFFPIHRVRTSNKWLNFGLEKHFYKLMLRYSFRPYWNIHCSCIITRDLYVSLCEGYLVVCSHRQPNTGGGGRSSDMSTDIIYLSIDPFFTPNDHVFHCSPHPMTHFFKQFQCKISKFSQLSAKTGNFSPKFDQIYTKFPHLFGNFTPKRTQFFWIPHPMTPFLLWNPTPNTPSCSLVGTYPALSYSSATPPPDTHLELLGNMWG